MDQDRPCRRRRRHRRQSCEDYISGLPDELLHSILLRLGSARAAARTSVLSRRWRPVWTYLPELVFGNDDTLPPPAPASFLDAVDGALAAYAAPTLEALIVIVPTAGNNGINVLARRVVAPWLRFAAERVVGEVVLLVPALRTSLYKPWPEVDRKEVVLELPACERAKAIALRLKHHWRLRLRPAGSEVTALVCTRCPCLRNLRLYITLVHASDISIRSGSLRSLSFCVRKTRRLEVVAPRLENLFLGDNIDAARFSAPKLERLVWNSGFYDPQRHRFDDIGRRLWLLDVDGCFILAQLMRRFDEVDEFKLGISIPGGNGAYKIFLDETNMMPKCKILRIALRWNKHGLAPVMLHLLRNCRSTKKLSIQLVDYCGYSSYLCWSYCPCRLEESRRAKGVALNSLEEVEITSHKSSQEELLEFVEQLLPRCNAAVLKKLVINYTTFFPLARTKVRFF
ncbi:unnamed protein product [Urochloa decumbens]|uniref:F-box domain-containing protein n=1 Tax=Urochloa decumbens TaxID=240449 RepID=A0ABC9ALC1_9POAL